MCTFLCGKEAQNESLPHCCLFFTTTLLTVFQTSSHFLNSSHHCLITQQPFPHSSMANHCSITTCLLLLSCHYGLLIAGQSTKKICHEKAVAAALNGSATKMRKRKKKEVHYCYLLHDDDDFKRSSSSFVRVHSPLATWSHFVLLCVGLSSLSFSK